MMKDVIDVDATDSSDENPQRDSVTYSTVSSRAVASSIPSMKRVSSLSSPAGREGKFYECSLFLPQQFALSPDEPSASLRARKTVRRQPYERFGSVDLKHIVRGGEDTEASTTAASSTAASRDPSDRLVWEGGQGTVCVCSLGTEGSDQACREIALCLEQNKNNGLWAAKDLNFKFRFEAEAAYQQALLMYEKVRHPKLIRYVAGEWGLQLCHSGTKGHKNAQERTFYLTILMPYYHEGDFYAVIKDNEENYRASRRGRGLGQVPCERRRYVLNPTRVAQLGLQVCAAVRHLHSQTPWPIVHGDIKAQNVLFHNGREQCVLIDLDVAFEYKQEGIAARSTTQTIKSAKEGREGCDGGGVDTPKAGDNTDNTKTAQLDKESAHQTCSDTAGKLCQSDTETELDEDSNNDMTLCHPTRSDSPSEAEAGDVGGAFLSEAGRTVSAFLSEAIFGTTSGKSASAKKRERDSPVTLPYDYPHLSADTPTEIDPDEARTAPEEGERREGESEGDDDARSPVQPHQRMTSSGSFDLSIQSFAKRPFTAEWAAPETLLSDGKDISPRSDVWSFGLLLLCLLTGRDCTFLTPCSQHREAPPTYRFNHAAATRDNEDGYPVGSSQPRPSSIFHTAAAFLRNTSRNLVSNLTSYDSNGRANQRGTVELLANSFEEWGGNQSRLSNTIRWVIHDRLMEAFDAVFIADADEEEKRMASCRADDKCTNANPQQPHFRPNKNRNLAAAMLLSQIESNPLSRNRLQEEYLSTFAPLVETIVSCLHFDPLQRPTISDIERKLVLTMSKSRMGPWEE